MARFSEAKARYALHMNLKRGGIFVILIALIPLVLVGCSVFDNDRALTLSVLMEGELDGPDRTTNPEEITSTVCGDAIDCVEAYSTVEANYYRFESRDDAAKYGAAVHDGFVVNYIVMDFEGKSGASKQEQLAAMEQLAGTWQDFEGTFPQR